MKNLATKSVVLSVLMFQCAFASAIENNKIVETAFQYLNKSGNQACTQFYPSWGCECKTFVQNVLVELGFQLGPGYCQAYVDNPHILEVDISEIKVGDIIQTTNVEPFGDCFGGLTDLTHANGMHTAIFLEYNHDGSMEVIDSNWVAQHTVGTHDWFAESWAAGQGMHVRVFRFGVDCHTESNTYLDSTLLNSCWHGRQEIVINHEQVSGDNNFYDFPVTLANGSFSEHLYENVNDFGSDIRFTSDEEGHYILPFEIDENEWDPETKKSVVYVKVPELKTNEDTTIYVWYDNIYAEAIHPYDAIHGSKLVWDEDHKAVWHLGELSGIRSDSTLNDNHLESYNGVNSTQSVIGKGAWFGGRGSGHCLSIEDSDQTGLNISQSMTFEGWLTIHELPGNYYYPTLFARTGSRYYKNSYLTRLSKGSSGSTKLYSHFRESTRYSKSRTYYSQHYFTEGEQYYVVVVRDAESDSYRLYINGEEVYNSSLSLNAVQSSNNIPFTLSSTSSKYTLNGVLDEVRFSDIPRNADYIRTQYNNQNDPWSFATPAD